MLGRVVIGNFGLPGEPALRLVGEAAKALLIVATQVLIFDGYRIGLARGHDSFVTTGGHGAFWNAVCGVLSADKYDTGRYACIGAALGRMMSAGLFYDLPSATAASDAAPCISLQSLG